MPSTIGSDTEIESDSGGLSKCKRQKNKPLMEKKRRARINRSLSQLKQILIQDEHKNSSQHSKWEKADILEMTVEYLLKLRSSRNPPTSSENPPTTPSSFPVPQMMVMNPMMQQYMAYQQLSQLTQLSMLQNFMSNEKK